MVWITQLGLTVGAPLAGFTLLGVWIQNRFQTGKWVILLFCALGFISAIRGFQTTLQMLSQMEKRKDDSNPGSSFNQHE